MLPRQCGFLPPEEWSTSWAPSSDGTSASRSRYGMVSKQKRYARRVQLLSRRHPRSFGCEHPQEGIDRSVRGLSRLTPSGEVLPVPRTACWSGAADLYELAGLADERERWSSLGLELLDHDLLAPDRPRLRPGRRLRPRDGSVAATRLSDQEKAALLRHHLDDGVPLTRIAAHAGVPERTLRRWVQLYRADSSLAGLRRKQRADRGLPAPRGGSLRVEPAQWVAGPGQGVGRARPGAGVHAQGGAQVRQGGVLDQRDALRALVGRGCVGVAVDPAEGVLGAEQGEQVGRARAEVVGVGEPVRAAVAQWGVVVVTGNDQRW